MFVGTKTVTISALPVGVSTSTSLVTKPNAQAPSRGCWTSTTALNELRRAGENASMSIFTDG